MTENRGVTRKYFMQALTANISGLESALRMRVDIEKSDLVGRLEDINKTIWCRSVEFMLNGGEEYLAGRIDRKSSSPKKINKQIYNIILKLADRLGVPLTEKPSRQDYGELASIAEMIEEYGRAWQVIYDDAKEEAAKTTPDYNRLA